MVMAYFELFKAATEEELEVSYDPRPKMHILPQRYTSIEVTEGVKAAQQWVDNARPALDQAIALLKQAAAEKAEHPEMSAFHAKKAKEVLATIK